MENSLEFAQRKDEEDELKEFRSRFFIPQHGGKDCVYFTGNSLGLQPKSAIDFIQQELNDWAGLGVEGHFQSRRPWYSYHEQFPELLKDLTGGREKELVVMNQLTVNLHLLMTSFYRPTAGRYKIICEAKAFPSDQYAFESQAKIHHLEPDEVIIAISPREGEEILREEDIISVIREHGETVALVIFGGVNYYSGQVFDMRQITAEAHKVGAYAGFDLAHAIGNIDLHLHDWDVDFACWCSYKYLNSGPGGVAGVFINERHVGNSSLPRLAGWWGYEKENRFKMEPGFKPIPTAEGWQLSNAPVLSMAAHLASLKIFKEAGFDRLRKKSIGLTTYLFYLLKELNRDGERVTVITPEGDKEYGCQVSLMLKDKGKDVFEKLSSQGIICDWREPNVIRVAPVPLYNRFSDVYQFVDSLKKLTD